MKAFPANFREIMVVLVFAFVAALPAAAHCDTMTGPVVTAARRSLETGDINTVLKWVHPEYENEVRAAFAGTRKVRILNAEARDLADKYFFETVVRLHRTGEGEPYTGLKSPSKVEPGIAALDKALESGGAKSFLEGFGPKAASEIRQRFARAQQAKLHADDSLAAGRQYVAAYVDLIHYLHGLEAGEHAGHAGAPSE